MTIHLTSSAFAQGSKIPSRFTCDGTDVSPPLAWSDVPADALSLALICSDPDAPSGVWYHWAIYDIPSDVTQLPEHCPIGGGTAPQALNDFHRKGYGGPCPPRGHGRHHYHFRLFALPMDHLPLPAGPGCRDVEKAASRYAIASTELVGVYSR